MNGYFLTTAANSIKNMGIDGTMWSFTFILPNDAIIGDVYPIDIVYKSGDRFTHYADDDEGDNMQAYTFKKGIYSVDNPTFKASANDILKVPALSKINKTYDGYIAVSSDNLILGDANCDERVTIADSVKKQSIKTINYSRCYKFCQHRLYYINLNSPMAHL